MDGGAWWAAVHGVAKSKTQLSDFTFTFHFHSLEKEMATHSSVLAWRIPGMGEPGGVPSLGSHRVGHDWSDLAAAAAILHILVCVCVCVFVNVQKCSCWILWQIYVWLFKKPPKHFLEWLSFYMSNINVQVIRFLCILNSIWYCHLFIFDRCSNRYLAILIMVFLCIFLMTNDEHPLMCLVAIHISSLMKCVHLFCPFSKWIVFFLSVYLISLRALSIF